MHRRISICDRHHTICDRHHTITYVDQKPRQHGVAVRERFEPDGPIDSLRWRHRAVGGALCFKTTARLESLGAQPESSAVVVCVPTVEHSFCAVVVCVPTVEHSFSLCLGVQVCVAQLVRAIRVRVLPWTHFIFAYADEIIS